MKLFGGEIMSEKGSEFQAFLLPTNNTEMINNLYMKLRLLFPQAKHIVCSFDIPGMPRSLHQDFCDDKENGAGNYLLNLMKQNDLNHLAIFVVRHQFGAKIGKSRFKLMKNAVISALQKHPYNNFTGCNQCILDDTPMEGEEQQTSRGRGAYSQKGFGPKYNRSQGSNIRGAHRIISNSHRQRRVDNNPEKRRRETSPTYTAWNNEPDFQFQPPIDAIKNMEVRSLGSSWPTLSQAQAMP